MALFRKIFLKPNQIEIRLQKGYCGQDKQSAEALMWFKYMEKDKNIEKETCLNGLKVSHGGYKVDSYCSNFKNKKTVFEYHVSK